MDDIKQITKDGKPAVEITSTKIDVKVIAYDEINDSINGLIASNVRLQAQLDKNNADILNLKSLLVQPNQAQADTKI